MPNTHVRTRSSQLDFTHGEIRVELTLMGETLPHEEDNALDGVMRQALTMVLNSLVPAIDTMVRSQLPVGKRTLGQDRFNRHLEATHGDTMVLLDLDVGLEVDIHDLPVTNFLNVVFEPQCKLMLEQLVAR